jgi:CubicO group peptidase (beta-lactamase class C family)
MTDIGGTCTDRFEPVRAALAELITSGQDVGACACVVLDGEIVADVWGGTVDADSGKPWERDTITNVWSTTKTMTAVCALLLADRGELDIHAPVARYWPEFGAAGKEHIEVRHLLSHTSGLSGWQEPLTVEDLYDWDRTCDLLARQEPWWEPGSASGYHALTQGFLVGEVVRRISGQSLGTFFTKEVAGPLGADFHIGVDPAHDGRVSRVIPPTGSLSDAGLEPGSIAMRTLANPPLEGSAAWPEGWRRAEIPAANGHGNARSVARVQSAVSSGYGGLLSDAGRERIFEEQCKGVDLVLGVPLRLGVGYGLNSPDTPIGPNPRTCFWGGWGGSAVVNDLDTGMTVAYVMNRMGDGTLGDTRAFSILAAAYAALAG